MDEQDEQSREPAVAAEEIPEVDPEPEPSNRRTKNYEEAINHYFKIKNEYETKVKHAKHQIYEKEENKQIAKKKCLAMKPIPCIHCKRPVGTIFSVTKQKLAAICGDKIKPCILNIDIYKGFITNIKETLDLYKEDIEYLKENIIQQKLDTLFSYINETQTVELFKKGLNAYNGDNVVYKEVLDEYNSLYKNQEKMDLITEKNAEIFRLIEKSRGFLQEYRKTQNTDFLKLAVETNVKEITPIVDAIRSLKYEVMEMNIDEEQQTFTLFTYPVLLSKIDYNTGEKPRVVKYLT